METLVPLGPLGPLGLLGILEFEWRSLLNVEQWNEWLLLYAKLGPIPGVILPLFGALIPFIPLLAIVIGNAAAFGLKWGFLYSWLGTFGGSMVLFGLFRRIKQRHHEVFFEKYPRAEQLSDWMAKGGLLSIFLLHAFPFTPAFIVNAAAGFSTVSARSYMMATMLGKGVMVFVISVVGYDLIDFWREPRKLIYVSLILTILWLGGKWLERLYQEKRA